MPISTDTQQQEAPQDFIGLVVFDNLQDRRLVLQTLDYIASSTICIIGVFMASSVNGMALATPTVMDDLVMAMTQILLDATSFVFVMYGFVFVFLYTHCRFDEILHKLICSIYVDHVGSCLWVAVVYSIELIYQSKFSARDLMWTIVEGLCVFNLPSAVFGRSLHVSLWPITSMLQSLMLLPYIANALKRLHTPSSTTSSILTPAGLGLCAACMVCVAAFRPVSYSIITTCLPLRVFEFGVGGALVFVEKITPFTTQNSALLCNSLTALMWLQTLYLTTLPAPQAQHDPAMCLQISPEFPCMPAWSVAVCRGLLMAAAVMFVHIMPERLLQLDEAQRQAQVAVQACDLYMQRVHTLLIGVLYAWPVAVTVRLLLRMFVSHETLGRCGVLLTGSLYPAALLAFLRIHIANKPHLMHVLSETATRFQHHCQKFSFRRIPEQEPQTDSEHADPP